MPRKRIFDGFGRSSEGRDLEPEIPSVSHDDNDLVHLIDLAVNMYTDEPT